MKRKRIYIYSVLGIASLILLSFLLKHVSNANTIDKLTFTKEKIWEASFFICSFWIFKLFHARRKWILATFFLILSIAWLFFQARIFDWINHLGADSFQETRNFRWKEALFWLTTMKTVLQLDFTLPRLFMLTLKIALLTTLAVLIFWGLKYLWAKLNFNEKLFTPIIFFASVVSMSLILSFKVSDSIALYNRSELSFQTLEKNFDNPLPGIEEHSNDLTTIVYIGESTSSMHMGVYGYPFSTTPNMEFLHSHNERFLLFENVYSTHTHTTPSLLEAFSFSIDSNERFLPINKRHRISLIEVLNKAGIETELFSNQGASGTNNLVGSIIFKNSKKVFSTASQLTGDLPVTLFRDKPFDDVFFKKFIPSKLKVESNKNKVIFLHSYAGHGFYLENIPPRFRALKKDFNQANPKSIIGNQSKSLVKDLEDYHAALKYIDYSIGAIYNQLEKSEKPMVLVYFSDHGEAPFAGRGHDSDRFIHEMLRVPFFIYFNKAAAKKYPSLYHRYKMLSENKSIATLSQFPSTLIDLLGIRVKNGTLHSINLSPPVGAATIYPPILVRETSKNTTYIDLNNKYSRDSPVFKLPAIDMTDELTNFHKLSISEVNPQDPVICYHRSNTLAKAVRGSFTCNGLEVDLNIDSNKSLELYHPPGRSVGMKLTTVFEIAKKKKLSIWLDGKNLHEGDNCNTLVEFLRTNRADANRILVEFPTGSYKNLKLKQGTNELKKMGCNISYYVPTETAKKCSESLEKGIEFKNEKACLLLNSEIDAVFRTRMFTDISFDYAGLKAIEEIRTTKYFNWNSWNLTAEEFKSIKPGIFQMVIFKNNDPNDL